MTGKMTRKAATLAAVERRETGEIPYQVLFLGSLKTRVCQAIGCDDINRGVGNYINWSLPPEARRVAVVHETTDRFTDEWGVVWAKHPENRGYVVERPLEQPDLARLCVPPLRASERMAGLAEACERDRDLFLLAWCGDLFERAHFLRGLDALMMDLHDRPRFVHGLLDVILERVLAVVEVLGVFPVDGIILSDDYGHQAGPLVSPAHFREFFLSRLRQVFAAIRRTGKKAFLHSCGCVTPFIDDCIDAGLDVLHPVQPEAMDVFEVKQRYGGHLCLYGGLSTQRTFAWGTPEDVRRDTLRAMAELGRGGGYILAPALDLQHDTPLDNVLAFLDAVRLPR
jgi:uroporphyrinogen decarboxylase